MPELGEPHQIQAPAGLDGAVAGLKNALLIWTYSVHSWGRSSSGKIAFTGHWSTHRPQSMQVSGSIYNCLATGKIGSFLVGWMQSTGQTSTQDVSFVPTQGWAMMCDIGRKFRSQTAKNRASRVKKRTPRLRVNSCFQTAQNALSLFPFGKFAIWQSNHLRRNALTSLSNRASVPRGPFRNQPSFPNPVSGFSLPRAPSRRKRHRPRCQGLPMGPTPPPCRCGTILLLALSAFRYPRLESH